ncbi:TPA: Ig-like domain-containing protein [Photobacterium damselae]
MNFKIIILFFLVAIISACGDENNNEKNDKKPTDIIITSQDSLSFLNVNKVKKINLSNKISSDLLQPLVLTNVEVLGIDNDNCDIVSFEGLTFTVSTNSPGVCRYKYTVKSASNLYNGESSGLSQVVVTKNATQQEFLEPITKAISESKIGKPQVLDLDLTSSIPDGYILDKDSFYLLGDTESGEIGTFSINSNTVKYTAPLETTGVMRLYFSVSNKTNETVRPGIIYIAVGQSTNTSPAAKAMTFLDAGSLIDNGRTIDISPFVVDPDGDRINLVNVFSNGIGKISNINNNSFYYKPDRIGLQYITYVVTDEHGGYALGQLTYRVSSYPSIIDSNQNIVFYPTKTLNELDEGLNVYDGIFTEDGSKGFSGNYPTFGRKLANSYCLTQGLTLATQDQFRSLFNNKLSSSSVFGSKYKWPAGTSYISDSGFFSLYDGSESDSLSPDNLGYISCVDFVGLAKDYSFDHKYLASNWEKVTTVTASTVRKGIHYPLSIFSLKAEVIRTQPSGFEDSVAVEIKNNKVTVKKIDPKVFSAVVKITDPTYVQGDLSETKILVGITACPDDISFLETQSLGCIPVMPVGKGSELSTIAVTDEIMRNIDFDIDNPPTLFSKTNTKPNYTWIKERNMRGHEANKFANEVGFYIQNYCDILNVNSIAGRTNWSWFESISSKDSPGYGSWVINKENNYQSIKFPAQIAVEATRWVSRATMLAQAQVGQGWLLFPDSSLAEFGITEIQQLNQAWDTNFGSIQGTQWPPKGKAWENIDGQGYQNQFITCYSPN